MKKIKAGLKKIIAILCNFLGLGLITGCDDLVKSFAAMYGCPPYVAGQVTGDIDGDGTPEPVEGIKVTVISEQDEDVSDTTDEEGRYSLSHGKGTFTVTFEDIDGEENGSFKTKKVENVEFKADENGWGIDSDPLDVELERE